jgi:hypothetical protein
MWGLTVVAVLGITSACGDSGSDGVGPSAVATGGENGRITLAATVAERSGTCPTIRFRLGSLIVETTSSTDFETPCDRIVNGRGIEAHAPLITGNVLSAREVEADDSAASNPTFEADGPIAILSSADDCAGSGRDMTVQGLTFRVSESTDFRSVPGCSALAAGLMVKARGPLATSSGAGIIPLRATRVERR